MSDVKAEPQTSPEQAPKPSGPEQAKRSFSSIALAVLGFAATLGVGFYAGQWIKEYFFTASATIEEGERYRVDLRGDEPQIGPNDALVTILEFSDFQCPYCAKVAEPLKDAMGSYEGDVRVVFKHFPLTGHKQAAPAAQAAWAAHQQGKFWEMHDLLFANQRALSDEDLGKLGEKLGLDLPRYETDRHSDAGRASVDADQTAGNKGGASGTPYFLVNGHPYSGALPAKQWREIIKYEMKAAQRLVDAGTPRAEVYTTLMKEAKASRAGKASAAAKRRPGEPFPEKTYRVPLDMRPQHGPDDALVTMVEFSDFQCPFCKKVTGTLDEIKEQYKGDLRLVFRQRPLPMHPEAREGAKAALAAHRQGKFWEMHDKLFGNPSDMSKPTFMRYAQELGLDTAMFELDLESAEITQMIKDDEAHADRLGSRGAPAFFINGRFISGAQPFANFAALIDEEKARAQKLVDAGTPRAKVYEKIMDGAEETPGP
ncbi:MAG: thioredoxin domain-containing protein [Nannocystis sp.]|nr:thioredoxin domain-containing protein [Nannocystis sp.]MBA3545192.1 thioredoxin domain-containing protein [Nannocystis sp.]